MKVHVTNKELRYKGSLKEVGNFRPRHLQNLRSKCYYFNIVSEVKDKMQYSLKHCMIHGKIFNTFRLNNFINSTVKFRLFNYPIFFIANVLYSTFADINKLNIVKKKLHIIQKIN